MQRASLYFSEEMDVSTSLAGINYYYAHKISDEMIHFNSTGVVASFVWIEHLWSGTIF